jgi:transcriptional regulator with XRE-family HTH domain
MERFGEVAGEVLRDARRKRGLTLRAVWRRSGGRFKPSALGGYERGERSISLDKFCGLAAIYGVAADRLLAEVLDRVTRSRSSRSTEIRRRSSRGAVRPLDSNSPRRFPDQRRLIKGRGSRVLCNGARGRTQNAGQATRTSPPRLGRFRRDGPGRSRTCGDTGPSTVSVAATS